ncbi:hypothetical protein FZEAL_6901 [Fusarium zealandicum]|uniref:Uncharacterized protein n=1 Tax=Fusarium zealandicum TaxID=1053134 RepID=A0A8H4UHP1_9HYPO|nr:hypothetical protein FZEAL_6901 [Fusarium zealandicum]
MSQPILSIKSDDSKVKAVANLLPCRIHHTGPVDTVSSYWDPTTSEGSFLASDHETQQLTDRPDGTRVAYFRGRKLHGKTVQLPEQCRGVVVERQQNKDPKAAIEMPAEDGDAEAEQIGNMHVKAEFDEMIVWGHEAIADAAGDPYVRSMEEWLQAADQIHSYSDVDETAQR